MSSAAEQQLAEYRRAKAAEAAARRLAPAAPTATLVPAASDEKDVKSAPAVTSGGAANANATAAAAVGDAEDESFRLSAVDSAELECALCLKLLFEPVTLPSCGHTFCRVCLWRALLTKANCPLCRHPASVGFDAMSHPTTLLIAGLLQKHAAKQYTSRGVEASAERRVVKIRYGVFLSGSTQFPDAKLFLHIFEPRYRVMISQAMSTHRCFVVLNANQLYATQSAAAQAAAQRLEAVENAAIRAAAAGGGPDAPPAVLDMTPPMAIDEKGVRRRLPSAAPVAPRSVVQPPSPDEPMRGEDAVASAVAAAQAKEAEGSDAGNAIIGCLVRIERCRTVADGRSHVESVGVSRVKLFNIVDDPNAFGLMTAEALPYSDEPEADRKLIPHFPLQPIEHPPFPAAPAGAAAGDSKDVKSDVKHAAAIEVEGAAAVATASGAAGSGSDSKPEGSGESAAVEAIRQELVSRVVAGLQRFEVAVGTTIAALSQANGAPPLQDPSRLSFWIAGIVPDNFADSETKDRCFRSVSSIERLQCAVELLEYATAAAATSKKWKEYGVYALMLAVLLWLWNQNS